MKKQLKIFDIFNQNDINYRLVEYDENSILIFVHDDKEKEYRKCLNSVGFSIQKKGTDGFQYIYKLKPEEYWIDENGYRIIVAFQMSCISLSNLITAKLPLDALIQQSIWCNKMWDESLRAWKLCNEDLFIYHVTMAIFNDKDFSSKRIHAIEEISIDYHSEKLISKMRGVYFNFTEKLIELINHKEYKDIIHNFTTFIEY